MYEIWSVVFLLVCAIADYKAKEIYVWFCLLNYFLAIEIKKYYNRHYCVYIIIYYCVSNKGSSRCRRYFDNFNINGNG